MKRNETLHLIDALAAGAKTPSESHGWAVRFWIHWVTLFICVGALTFWLTQSFPEKAVFPDYPLKTTYILGAFLWLALAVLLARLAYLSAIPLSDSRHVRWALLGVAVLQVSLTLIQESPLQILSTMNGELDVGRGPCGIIILMTGAIAGTLFIMSFRKAAPTSFSQSGFWALATTGSVSSFYMHLICRFENASHSILWHALPILILGTLGTVLGMRILRKNFAVL